MSQLKEVRFGNTVTRRKIRHDGASLYIKEKNTLWEVELKGSKYIVVGPYAVNKRTRLKALPPQVVDQLASMPETGMGYQIVDLKLKDGTIIHNVAVLNNSMVSSKLIVSDVTEVMASRSDAGFGDKVDNLVKAVQEMYGVIGCDPTTSGRALCTNECRIRHVCMSMNDILMWGVIMKASQK